MYRIFTFREFKSIHKGKTAILHLRFGTEKNRRLGSKKAQYNRAFRRRHLFCLHIMAQMVHSLGSLPCSPTRTRPSKQPPAVSLLRNRLFESLRLHNKKSRRQKAVGIFGADGSFARLASALADTHTTGETATGCFFASQPPFRISPPAPIKNPVGKKPSGFLAQMERFELSRRLPTLRP